MFKPTTTRIAVKPDAPIEEINGLVLTNPGKPTTGVIQAVGPDVQVARPGDKVVFSVFAGTDVDGLLFMHEKEIIALDQEWKGQL